MGEGKLKIAIRTTVFSEQLKNERKLKNHKNFGVAFYNSIIAPILRYSSHLVPVVCDDDDGPPQDDPLSEGDVA